MFLGIKKERHAGLEQDKCECDDRLFILCYLSL